MLRKRPDNVNITFSGSAKTGNSDDREALDQCESFVLKDSNTDIWVHEIRSNGKDKYTAKIYGFEPKPTTRMLKYQIGQKVDFSEEHIFCCSFE